MCYGQVDCFLTQFNFSKGPIQNWSVSIQNEGLKFREQGSQLFFGNTGSRIQVKENIDLSFNGVTLYDNIKQHVIDNVRFNLSPEVFDFNSNTGSLLEGSTIFAEKPGSEKLIYIFHQDGGINCDKKDYNKIYYSIFNTEINEIEIQNELIYEGNVSNLCILPHKNGIDYWIVFINFDSLSIELFLISKEGITYHNSHVVNYNSFFLEGGSLVYNRNCNSIIFHNVAKGLIFIKFDMCSGEVVNSFLQPNTGSNCISSTSFFTKDGEYVLFTHYSDNGKIGGMYKGLKQIEIFDVSRIGIDAFPKWIIPLSDNFTPGSAIYADNNMQLVLLSKIVSNRYYFIEINDLTPPKFISKKLPFYYIPNRIAYAYLNTGLDLCVSNQQNLATNKIATHLNPFHNSVFITTNFESENIDWILYDAMGNILEPNFSFISKNYFEIDFQLFPSGFYFLVNYKSGTNEKLVKY